MGVANKAEKIIDFWLIRNCRSLGIARDMGSVLGIRTARCTVTITKGNVEKFFLRRRRLLMFLVQKYSAKPLKSYRYVLYHWSHP